MATSPLLIPYPRHFSLYKGFCKLKPHQKILIDYSSLELLNFGLLAQKLLQETAGIEWELTAWSGLPPRELGLRLALNPHLQGSESYQLQVYTHVIELEAADPPGLFYGLMTLKQLFRQYPTDRLPCLFIRDWPDFRHRGFMLDISRDKVPTQTSLYRLVDQMAELKLNQLQLYMEHTFAYTGHEEVWKDATPLTGQEILLLDRYCRERFVELVPNQNSFGHLHRWLTHPRYRSLAECAHPNQKPFSLCPLDPAALDLLASWYSELLPHFSSRQFNIGCDETHDLGKGRSREACEKLGTGRVYLDFLSKIHALASQRGHVPQFWGDIILHHPALIPEIPRPIIALNWGYEADHPFEEECQSFAAAGIPFYVCPGTSSWNSLGGRTDNALTNLCQAAQAGLKHHAIGYLITDWGDHGHWQPWAISLLPLSYGASLAWCASTNQALDLCQAANLHVFKDPGNQMASFAFDLGNTYQKTGIHLHNQSVLFYLLLHPTKKLGEGLSQGLDLSALKDTKCWLDQLYNRLETLKSQRSDGHLLVDEFKWATQMLMHACRLAILRLKNNGLSIPELPADIRRSLATNWRSLMNDFQRIWLARNRQGGLCDSMIPMKKLLSLYENNAPT